MRSACCTGTSADCVPCRRFRVGCLRWDLAGAINSLPDHYRQIVVLRDIEELTIDEIAFAIDASREAVKARLHRARLLLREYLQR